MNLIINDFEIDKTYLLQLLADNQKLLAVKYIKENTDLSLQDCKGIADNLQNDPNYYDEKEDLTIPSFVNHQVEPKKTEEPKKVSRRKGNYLKDDNKSQSNTYIILFILIVIVTSIYFFSNK